MNLLELALPLKDSLFTTVRLAVGGICALKGFDLDDSEDCKVCVTESLLLLKHGGFSHARVTFYEADGVGVKIEGEGVRGEADAEAEDDISLALLSALLGEVQEEKEKGRLCGISFVYGKQA